MARPGSGEARPANPARPCASRPAPAPRSRCCGSSCGRSPTSLSSLEHLPVAITGSSPDPELDPESRSASRVPRRIVSGIAARIAAQTTHIEPYRKRMLATAHAPGQRQSPGECTSASQEVLQDEALHELCAGPRGLLHLTSPPCHRTSCTWSPLSICQTIPAHALPRPCRIEALCPRPARVRVSSRCLFCRCRFANLHGRGARPCRRATACRSFMRCLWGLRSSCVEQPFGELAKVR